MKVSLIVVALCCFYQISFSVGLCLPNCRDISAMPGLCPLMRSQCKTNRMIRGFCLKTCQVCTSCPVIEEEDERRNDVGTIGTSTGQPAGCDIDDCVDLAPADQCAIIRNTRGWCEAYPKSCRRTCGQCKPCAIPKPELKCTTDCENSDDSCEHWESLGYCNTTSIYHDFMTENCHKSCGICKLCPTPAPKNTALPPTEIACTTDCRDSERVHCQRWFEGGYCNKTEEFPFIKEVCAMTCGACKLCPTEAPTAPPCDPGCLDDNEECEYWEEKGYCNETNGFPYVIEICPKACGKCTPCPDEEEEKQSTALPPTKEEAEKAAEEKEKEQEAKEEEKEENKQENEETKEEENVETKENDNEETKLEEEKEENEENTKEDNEKSDKEETTSE